LALPRGSVIAGVDAKIGIKFSKGGVPFDVTIVKMVTTNPDGTTMIEYTSGIIQEAPGCYFITVPGADIPDTGLYLDTWFFKVNATAPTQSVVQDFFADTPRKPELKETRVPQCSSQHCL